ncbi:MAG: hypothetical protein ACRCUH_10305 [Shewanella sp.]
MTTKAITFAGTTVSISAGVPATYNEAGFAALTYAEIGEIVTVPGTGGTTYEDVAVKVVGRRATLHFKGSSDQEEESMEILVDRTDAGQNLALAARDSDNQYAFKVVYSNGEIDYYQALVYSFVGAGGGSDDMRQATISFRRDSRDVVSVAAP